MNALKLPREITQLIDRYVNAQTEQDNRHGDLPYILGFSDCIELLPDKDRFPCVDEHDGSKRIPFRFLEPEGNSFTTIS